MVRQAVILAAGKGKRMKKNQTDPLILSTPKPLLMVKGKTIIEHIINKLMRGDVKIAVVINPNDEIKFRERLKNYDIEYCYQYEPLGTANALYAAKSFVTEELFFVFMGDDISNFDVDELLNVKEPTVFGYELEDVSNYGAILTDSNGIAYKILEKRVSGKRLANTGIYVLPKLFFDLYNEIPIDENTGEYYLTHIVKILYDHGIGLKVNLLNYWRGINTIAELSKANETDHERLIIRKAKVEDIPRLMELLHQLSPIDNLDEEKDKTELRELLNKIIFNDDYYLMVAEMNGDVVATATLLIQLNLTHYGRPYGHIENVVTDLNYRGQNIGKRLIQYLIEIAKVRNCYKVILNCSEKNIKFYQKCWFFLTNEVEMRVNL